MQSNPLMDLLRQAIKERLPDAVEQVRPHRVVFGRGDVLRTFADLQPDSKGVNVTFRLPKGSSPTRKDVEMLGFGMAKLHITSQNEITEILEILGQAYKSV